MSHNLSGPTHRPCHGFTLIELMVVAAIIAILATIALTAYQHSIIRTQAAEASSLMAGARISVAEYYSAHGTPPANRAAAGMTANATSTQGQFVSGVDITNGEITATYGNNANARISGRTLVHTPYVQADGSISWQCSSASLGASPGGSALSGPTAGTIQPRYAPAQCR